MKLKHEFSQFKDFFKKPRLYTFQINIHILDCEKFIVQLRARREIHLSDHNIVTWPQQRAVFSDSKQEVNNSLLIKMRGETETHVLKNPANINKSRPAQYTRVHSFLMTSKNVSPSHKRQKFLECTPSCYHVPVLIGGYILGFIFVCKCKL